MEARIFMGKVKSIPFWVVTVTLVFAAAFILCRRYDRIIATVRRFQRIASSPDDRPVPGAGLRASKNKHPERYHNTNRDTARLKPPSNRDPATSLKNQRFIDVGGRAYSRAFIDHFDYGAVGGPSSPSASITWLKRSETFTGTLIAENLKPNFAYQMKLAGIPEAHEAFERIGRVGRWKLPGTALNVSDRQYFRLKNKQDAHSYLLFDFFITDDYGRAVKTFYADSSLHVLFNERQRSPRSGDSASVTVGPSDPGDIYANPFAVFEDEHIYAENESGSPSGNQRPPIGQAWLQTGHYKALFVLTEESFHWFGDGGAWATVLEAPVEFEVVR